MSDEHDSWFKDAFGVDLGLAVQGIKDEASAVVGQVTSTVTQAAQSVEGALGEVAGAVGGVVKKVAGAVSPSGAGGGDSGSGASGGTGSFPLGGSVGRGGKNAPNDVRTVQAALGISADGQCGGGTIAAIEAFQRNMGQAKPDGRVDTGGGTERALAGGAKPAAIAPTPAAEGDGSPSLFDRVVQGAEDLGGKVIKEVGDDLDAAKAFGGSVIKGAEDLSGGGANPVTSVPEGDEGLLKTLEDAAAGLQPGRNVPGLGDFDIAAALNQAANQVVGSRDPKIPLLERAEALLGEASAILDRNADPSGSIQLPAPIIGFSGACCSPADLDKFRAGLETPRNSLQLAINAFKDADRAVIEAAEQGKIICQGSFVACIFAGLRGLGASGKEKVQGIAACVAATVTCIGASFPVQNAIRLQAKAEADLAVANSALERALANHRSCFVQRCPPAGGDSPPVIELDDPPVIELDDPPVDEFNP